MPEYVAIRKPSSRRFGEQAEVRWGTRTSQYLVDVNLLILIDPNIRDARIRARIASLVRVSCSGWER